MPLHPDVALDVTLAAICARHRFTTDPGPVLDELRRIAEGRADVLAAVAGSWAGYHGADPHVQPLVRALLEMPGAAPWAVVGRGRRLSGVHGTGRP